jgi:hypothetical protein
LRSDELDEAVAAGVGRAASLVASAGSGFGSVFGTVASGGAEGDGAPAAAAAAGPPAAGFTLSFAKAFHFWTSPAATALMPGSS